jgi:hypothetical protein
MLHAIWKRALMKGDRPLDLGEQGVTTTMVYWADVLYAAPDPNVAEYESVREQRAEAVDAGGDAAIPQGTTEVERRFLQRARARLTSMTDSELERADEATPGATALERIPLPWFLKKRIMAAQIRDAHHYLFNIEFSPRAGVTYCVQDEIRRRFLAALDGVSSVSRPHVVVSHSMGTMIAYDCLKRVSACASIDGLMTIGSPLGIDEVQDCFAPEWTREDGYPERKVVSRWVNVFDRLDVVCGADPEIANDFRADGRDRIEDVSVTNEGVWRHSIVKYLLRDSLRNTLRRMLDLAPQA